MVDYATIVAGRVTDVMLGAGALPTSDLTTYYHRLYPGDAVPDIGDYFAEICGTFSPTAPIIPDNELAPPYPPGGTPWAPGDEDYPLGPLNPGPTPPPDLLPDLITFHADRVEVVTIPSCPSALTEVSTQLRTFYDFTDVCAVRLQAVVIDELAGAELVLCYYDVGEADWLPLSRAGTGPVLSLDNAGDVRGMELNVAADAQDDVLVSPFVRGGDGATTVTLGNLHAFVRNRLQYVPCTEIPEDECAMPEGAEPMGFDTFASTAALETFTGGVSAPSNFYSFTADTTNAIDSVVTWRGDKTLRMDWNPGNPETLYGAYFGGATGQQDFAHLQVLQLAVGFDATTGSGGNDGVTLSELDIAKNGGSDNLILSALHVVDGRLLVRFIDYTAATVYGTNTGVVFTDFTDVGAVSTYVDRFVQLITRVTRYSNTSARIQFYLNDACATPTLLYEDTKTLVGTGRPTFTDLDNVQQVQFNTYVTPSSPTSAWSAWLDFTFDPVADFGLSA